MSNPWAPLPAGPESEWTAKDHQRAANFHHYEMQGYNEEAYKQGLVDANYKPMQTFHKKAFEDHQRKAQRLRAFKVI